MAFDTPTPADLKARYPEFDAVADPRVSVFIADALTGVSTDWEESDYTSGILAFAAHLMAMEGEPQRSNNPDAAVSPVTLGQEVMSRKVGDVSIAYQVRSRWVGTGTLDSTPYGRRYKYLLRMNAPALLVV